MFLVDIRQSKKGRLGRKGEANTAVDKSQLGHKERKKLLKEVTQPVNQTIL